MRHRAPALLALSSAAIAAGLLNGATRPRYGGTLRVQLAAALPDAQRSPLVAETLVRMDGRGAPQPLLARSWQADSDKRRWRFTLRPRILFHDGTPLTGAAAAASLEPRLKQAYGDVTITANGQTLTIQAGHAMSDLLESMARPEFAISRPGAATGPFRIAKWEPPRHALLTAFDEYWGGRPFLDAVDLTVAPPRSSAVYQLSSADIWELPVAVSRRSIPEGMRVWTSPPDTLLALYIPSAPQQVREALAISIDRAAIVNVLLQRHGEVAQGLLPEWLSGYAFLFPYTVDAARGRQLVAPLKPGALTLAVPAGDALARSVGDRVMVNARDAGLTLQPASLPAPASIQLLRIPVASTNAALDLRDIASATGQTERLRDRSLDSPEALYEAERALLEDGRVIPLVHVSSVFGLGARVRNWDEAPYAADPLAKLVNVWLQP